MGFWHTGYMEFHEPVGLDDYPFEPPSPVFPCTHCGRVFHSSEELRQHRFETHPLRRPVLFLQGHELGTNPVRITRFVKESDVYTDNCDQAFLNGYKISASRVPSELSKISSGVYKLKLSKEGVSAEFSLNFDIASKNDLEGVESQFEKMVRGYKLNIRVIEDFILATKDYETAVGYTNGICEYLYGVLIKERAPDATLPYEAYEGKFKIAAEALSVYERPLARTIGSLIEFNFNHFTEATSFVEKARIGYVSKRYAAWLQGRKSEIPRGVDYDFTSIELEVLLTDDKTEQILRWSCESLDSQIKHVEEMESFLKRDIGKYDSVKIRVLLGEIYSQSGDILNALKHAKVLRNLPIFERWAEAMIRTHTEKTNGQI